MVMKIRTLTYHVACFSCSNCEKKLTIGDEFVFREREDDILCRDCDTNNIEQPSSIKTEIYGGEDEDNWDGSTLTSLDNQMSNTPPLSLRSPKSDESTRVRTVLNEKQLMTLKACYAANARPDAMMKEHLVEMTGLSPRVIRVWFQNKRCKDKKRQIAMKHLQQKAETVSFFEKILIFC
uniref:Homeobox domain-containing protein n=2 Tax=Onchocerca TaxID=6281 RepID=A0A2K6VIS9_ONCVO